MARYKTNNYFEPGTANTICDRTGFKVKLSQTVKTWDGFRVIGAANIRRNPQDYAPNIAKPAVHKESRTEQHENTDVITAPNPV